MSFVSIAVRLLPAAFVLLPGAALAQDARRPEEPFTELPIVDWQEELRLSSEVRQVIFNAYLPMLARPTFYKGTHDDEVPNQVKDWAYQRQSSAPSCWPALAAWICNAAPTQHCPTQR